MPASRCRHPRVPTAKRWSRSPVPTGCPKRAQRWRAWASPSHRSRLTSPNAPPVCAQCTLSTTARRARARHRPRTRRRPADLRQPPRADRTPRLSTIKKPYFCSGPRPVGAAVSRGLPRGERLSENAARARSLRSAGSREGAWCDGLMWVSGGVRDPVVVELEQVVGRCH